MELITKMLSVHFTFCQLKTSEQMMENGDESKMTGPFGGVLRDAIPDQLGSLNEDG